MTHANTMACLRGLEDSLASRWCAIAAHPQCHRFPLEFLLIQKVVPKRILECRLDRFGYQFDTRPFGDANALPVKGHADSTSDRRAASGNPTELGRPCGAVRQSASRN